MKGKHVSYSPLIIKRRNPECRNGGEVKPRCMWAPSERVPFLTSRRVQPTDHGHMWASHKMLSTRKNFGLLYHCIADPYLLESAIFSSNMWEKLPSYYGSPLFLRPASNPLSVAGSFYYWRLLFPADAVSVISLCCHTLACPSHPVIFCAGLWTSRICLCFADLNENHPPAPTQSNWPRS